MLKEIYPLSSVKYFECIHNSYGSIIQSGRSSDSESYLYKANSKSNYDRHAILTGSGGFCYNNKTDLIRVNMSGKTNGKFEIMMTVQNNFNGQGGENFFPRVWGRLKEKIPLSSLKYIPNGDIDRCSAHYDPERYYNLYKWNGKSKMR